jgi:hypothetical protein
LGRSKARVIDPDTEQGELSQAEKKEWPAISHLIISLEDRITASFPTGKMEHGSHCTTAIACQRKPGISGLRPPSQGSQISNFDVSLTQSQNPAQHTRLSSPPNSLEPCCVAQPLIDPVTCTAASEMTGIPAAVTPRLPWLDQATLMLLHRVSTINLNLGQIPIP